jgi:hypothetical protein
MKTHGEDKDDSVVRRDHGTACAAPSPKRLERGGSPCTLHGPLSPIGGEAQGEGAGFPPSGGGIKSVVSSPPHLNPLPRWGRGDSTKQVCARLISITNCRRV